MADDKAPAEPNPVKRPRRLGVRNTGERSSRKIKAIEHQENALRHRLIGLTFVDIGKAMGLSEKRARELVNAAMERREASLAEVVETVRKTELLRIDHMFRTHFLKQGENPESAAICIKLMERRAKLIGLDAPDESRVAHRVDRGEAPYDVSKLSLEEARTLRDLLAKSGAVVAPSDVPALPAPSDDSVVATVPINAEKPV